MPIPVSCPGCGKRFQAPDHGAGKKAACPACNTILQIPVPLAAVDDEEDDDYRLAPAAVPPPAAKPVTPALPPRPPAVSQRPPATAPSVPTPSPVVNKPTPTAAPSTPGWVPTTRSSTPDWLRHLHWCLAIALLPLAGSVFFGESPEEIERRIVASLADEEPASAPPTGGDSAATSPPGTSSLPTEPQPPAPTEPAGNAEPVEFRPELLEFLVMSLPGHKFQGALLARDSQLHWLFAFISVAAFLAFCMLLASDNSANPIHLVGLGLFTATVGIFLLLTLQAMAAMGVPRVRGIFGLVVLVVLLVGIMYGLALDPEVGFVGSLFGFTFGVGLCEELCKAIPLLFFYKAFSDNKQSWRGAFLWGLASGVGFGVSEGIMYSSEYYNGISGLSIYLVRFASCVALHAVWAGSVGISINQRQYILQEEHDAEEWYMYLVAVLQLIAIPMFLHGLYDTLLKKDMEFLALLAAAGSFGYLAWQISHLRHSDDEDERAKYVSQYIRSRAAG